jgi:hypothetical protein
MSDRAVWIIERFGTWSHFAEQRCVPLDCASVRDVGSQTRDLVDATPNVLVVGAREGIPGKA